MPRNPAIVQYKIERVDFTLVASQPYGLEGETYQLCDQKWLFHSSMTSCRWVRRVIVANLCCWIHQHSSCTVFFYGSRKELWFSCKSSWLCNNIESSNSFGCSVTVWLFLLCFATTYSLCMYVIYCWHSRSCLYVTPVVYEKRKLCCVKNGPWISAW